MESDRAEQNMKMIIICDNGRTIETTLEDFISNSMKGSYHMGRGEGLLGSPPRDPAAPEGVFSISGDTIIQDKTIRTE